MDYLTGLKTAAYVASITLFVMSWDLVAPAINKFRKVFGR